MDSMKCLPCLVQFESIYAFLEYLEIERDLSEAIRMIELLENQIRDAKIVNSEFMTRIYKNLNDRSDMEKWNTNEKYFKMKYRYLIYQWYQDKVSSCTYGDQKNIVEQIDSQSNLAAFIFYILLFHSKSRAEIILKENSTYDYLAEIREKVQNYDYLSLADMMKSNWYVPLVKDDGDQLKFITIIDEFRNSAIKDRTEYDKFRAGMANVSRSDSIFSQRNDLEFLQSNGSLSNTLLDRTMVPNSDYNLMTTINNSSNTTLKSANPRRSESLFMFSELESKTTSTNVNGIQHQNTVMVNSGLKYQTAMQDNILPESDLQTCFITSPAVRKFIHDGGFKSNYYDESIIDLNQAQNNIDETLLDETCTPLNDCCNYDVEWENETAKSFGPYTFTRLLGEGSFSKVFEASRAKSNILYAVKIISFNEYVCKKDVELEIGILHRMSETGRSVLLYESKFTSTAAVIVMEVASMSMKSLMEKKKKDVDHVFILHYWKLMMLCVEAMHEKRLAHMDLKMQNFVVTAGADVKLIDYGTSRELHDQISISENKQVVGTIVFMPPEMMRRAYMVLPKKVDIWSMGIVLYFMVYDNQPCRASSHFEYCEIMKNPNFKFKHPDVPLRRSNLLLQLMNSCLQYCPNFRLTATELLQMITPGYAKL